MNYTKLVNKENLISPSDLTGIDLVKIEDISGNNSLLETETYKNFKELKKYIYEKTGVTIGIESAFRSAHEQRMIYLSFVDKYGKQYADKIVAPVNASEHQLGLAIDVQVSVDGIWVSNNDEFEKAKPLLERYLHPYLERFGFILRYPAEKESETKIPYEPWHIRYVTKPVAEQMTKNNWSLEEFSHKDK